MSLSTGVMGLLGLGLNVAGVAANASAAYQQTKAQNAAAEWNAGILEGNAAQKEVLAEHALLQGEHTAAAAKRKGELQIESQRASYAASGVKVDSGSSLDVIAEQAGYNRYDQDMIKYNAALTAWGYNADAYNLRQNAAMTRATKQSAGTSALTSLLGGSTNLLNQYSRYQIDYGAGSSSSTYVPLLGNYY